MIKFITRMRSVVTGRSNGSAPTTQPHVQDEPTTEEPATSLFQCPSCNSVYIAIEMEQCSNCEIAVEPT